VKLSKIIFLVSFLVFICVGCNTVNYSAIYDDNEKIAESNASYSSIGSSDVTLNNSSTIKYNTFNGKINKWSITSNGNGSISIDYELNINKGRFKCVLVNPLGEVTIIFDETSTQKTTINLLEGKSIIKFVGDDAGFQLKIKMSTNENASLKKLE